MVLNVHLLRYLWEVREELPGSRKQRKQILSRVESSVRDFVAEHPGADYAAIVSHFGTPTQIAESNIEEMLAHLSERIYECTAQGIGFPHEIGAFLGYPTADVQSFIEKEGRDFIMTGYWKVYSNPEKARMIFHEYDRAKVCAVNEYLDGKNIREIALNQRKWRNL